MQEKNELNNNSFVAFVGARQRRVGFGIAAAVLAAVVLIAPAQAQFQQQSKLVGAGAQGPASQGYSVAISSNGTTAIVGGPSDNNVQGAAWIFTRTSGIWSQQGVKLTGAGGVLQSALGYSVAISADGNTAVVGGPYDNAHTGAAWVFVRTNGVWSQQGPKLVPGGAAAGDNTGWSVALSSDGNTALIGAPSYNNFDGAAYVYVRQGSVWVQQVSRLVGTGALRPGSLGPQQGISVALSSDGNTALVGGEFDNGGIGAGWVFTRNAGSWSQQMKLVGMGYVPTQLSNPPCTTCVGQGASAALSSDGNVAALGGLFDNNSTGATWIFTRAGSSWSQLGNKLVGSGGVGATHQGTAVALSSDGSRLLEGGYSDNSDTGAVWLFVANGGVFSQSGSKAVGGGAVAPSWQGTAVSLSMAGDTALVGGPADAGGTGAAWAFTATPVTPPTPLGFFTVNPCRAVDTRPGQKKTGSFGPPFLSAYVLRDFPLRSACGIPTTAQAYSLNFTVQPSGPLSFLTAWPSGQTFPGVSTLNSPNGDTIANAAIVPAGTNGNITAVAGNTTDLIIDTNGYFAPVTGSELLFYALTPCRVVDTRTTQNQTGQFGPPSLNAYSTRNFDLPADDCGIPSNAKAYALNVTAVPQGRLDFVSVFPEGQGFPGVSTLNSPHGNVIANEAIVPAGTNGGISVIAGQKTDLIIDISGYFAPPAMGGLHFYPVVPCRVMDTRADQGRSGPFGPPALQPYASRDVPISTGSCNIPSSAQAYSLNFTVVPQGPLDFLSAYPSGQSFPGVSTLNSPNGSVIANAAIVPAGPNGAITLLAGNPTDVVIDVNGYFAP